MNLLTNAREAMPGGGQVAWRPGRPSSGLDTPLVADGRRHPGREISKIFDPFFTTKRTGRPGALGELRHHPG
jgi:signal transduction histidine kinase